MLPNRNSILAKRASRYEVDEESVSSACVDLDYHVLSTPGSSQYDTAPLLSISKR